MTNHEAISILNQINSIISQDESWSETAKKAYSDAVSMATSALESHEVIADEDTISRKQAIDAMGRATWAINRINELPSAQPEP